jgi:hypothetical protein
MDADGFSGHQNLSVIQNTDIGGFYRQNPEQIETYLGLSCGCRLHRRIAGIKNAFQVAFMTYWNFLLFVIFGRLPGVFVTVFIGSGSLKLPVFAWVLLGLGTGVVLYFSARYGEKIEDFLLTKLKKLSKSDLKGD